MVLFEQKLEISRQIKINLPIIRIELNGYQSKDYNMFYKRKIFNIWYTCHRCIMLIYESLTLGSRSLLKWTYSELSKYLKWIWKLLVFFAKIWKLWVSLLKLVSHENFSLFAMPFLTSEEVQNEVSPNGKQKVPLK